MSESEPTPTLVEAEIALAVWLSGREPVMSFTTMCAVLEEQAPQRRPLVAHLRRAFAQTLTGQEWEDA
jgi:hypothetical protein